ncbi:MAG: plastocyanin/azurin family copper-binding protein [Halobacteriota archaeon]
MKRRDFLRAAGGASAAATATAAAGTAAAQEGGNDSAEGGGGGGTATVAVGPGNALVFTPGTDEPLRIAPGTTVNFVWESDNHNIVVESQPEGANWEGTPGAPSETYDTGYEYSYTFETLGTYEYYCEPHLSAGMVGTIEVLEDPEAAAANEPKELEELGVPIQAHWVGSTTVLGIVVSIVYTFYILKYGESPNTGNTGGRE